MASFKNVNWGAVIIGAVAVTAIAALSTITVGGAAVSYIAAMSSGIGISQGAVAAGTALAGGAIGQKVANLFHRGQDAAVTLVGR